MRGMED
jgi:ribosomal protein S17E